MVGNEFIGIFHVGLEFQQFVDEQRKKLGSKFTRRFKFVVDDKNTVHGQKLGMDVFSSVDEIPNRERCFFVITCNAREYLEYKNFLGGKAM